MHKVLIAAAVSVLLPFGLPAQAAVLSFDLSGLADSFDILGPVTGSFSYDTVQMSLSSVQITTDLDDYSAAEARVVEGAGFGLPAQFFQFKTAMMTFFFGIESFDLAMPGLDVGQSRVFSDVFGFESDDVSPEYVIGLDGKFAVYFGPVAVTRLADDLAPVPLPAGMPLLLGALGALGVLAARNSSKPLLV